MNGAVFESAEWFRALTLTERVATLAGAVPSPGPVDPERVRRRSERWRSQPPFDRDGQMTRRLVADGLTEEGFTCLLGADDETLRRLARRPRWLVRLERDLSAEDAAAGATRAAEPGPGTAVTPFQPLVAGGRRRLRAGAREIARAHGAGAAFDPETADRLLLSLLHGRLARMVNRTVALEVQASRLEGRLHGDSPEERFRGFVERASRPDALAELLRRYPVLGRELAQAIDQWVAFGLDLLRHLAEDSRALRGRFGRDPAPLAEVRSGLSDLHRGGRSVLFVRFASGLSLVYKPRPLAVEARFQELLGWVNGRGFRPALRRLAVLDRGDHGWVERVEVGPCATVEAVRRFYERQGGLLALLATLEGTDFHHENVLAAGDHPVAVDLESLFHPGLTEWDGDLRRSGGEVLYPSLLRVGLLPERIWAEDGAEGVDISGLGGERGQMSPQPLPSIEGQGTDEMRFVRRRSELPEAGNRPRLGLGEVDPTAFIEALAVGYGRMARILGAHGPELLATGGPVAAFAGVEVRVIARPTKAYSLLLLESFHPHVLADALDRDRLFDRLWVAVADRPYLERLLAAERRALQRGDVPVFLARPGSRDLWSEDGERFAGFFSDTGLERVAGRLRGLADPEEVERQLLLLRGSMAAAALTRRGEERWPALRLAPALAPLPAERFLAGARAVGERLRRQAIPIGEHVAWFELAPVAGTGGWSFRPLGPELYGGLAGIALFLAHLGRLTGDTAATGLARKAWASVRSLLDRAPQALGAVGAFAGWGSLLYAQAHLGLLWGEEEMVEETELLGAGLADRIDADERFDLIAGSAGCLLVLLSLHRLRPEGPFLDLARRCGERLLTAATATPGGTGWVIPGSGERPLTGLSHGAAGIAWALLALAATTRESRFRSTALEALRYERGLFLPAHGNWPDLRASAALEQSHGGPRAAAERFEVAWCHGAPGIGLARLACLPYLEDDREARREIAVAVETTSREGLRGNHSLCHGALGNLDVLLTIGRATADRGLLGAVDRLAAAAVASLEADAPFYGAPLGAEIPGLLTGLAGIGYGLLRLAAPEEVPSVLRLELPGGGGAP